MAPLKTNALKEIVWRLMTHGAIHRANVNLHKSRFAGTADEYDQLLALDDEKGVGRLMRAIISVVGRMQTPSDAGLLAAFEIAGLDHKNPMHWWVLLVAFCEHHFAEPKSKPVIRDDEFRIRLLDIVNAAEREDPNLRENLTSLARVVRDRVPEFQRDTGPPMTEGYVAARIREARDPSTNLALRYPDISDPFLRQIRADYDRMGLPWTPEIEKKNLDMIETVRTALDEVKTELGVESD